MSTGHPELVRFVEAWKSAVDDFLSLVEGLSPEQFAHPTDLPGWNVHAVVAHVAHLEALQAGHDHDDVETGDPAHVRNDLGRMTEQGVVARRGVQPRDLVAEIRECTEARHAALLAAPPSEPDAPAPGVFAFVGWSLRTLLSNRPLDVAMHEQDIRRALDLPGNLDGAGSVHAAEYLLDAVGYVLAKRAQAAEGTTVRWFVEGHAPRAWQVGEDRRARQLDVVPPAADLTLSCGREEFLLLAGGRRPVGAVRVDVDGDTRLAQRVLENLAVTP
ncbi:maleylpyruvate isomerase family mycothiol-dependent enzyme [Nocardioides yefusunii]|uniref:Maleylpyruvate isomerase family mycothiol-dependent enzyme n=1 Tax=Nocardioides yefusunii TaxID=2500546 RepID=A0ABW1QVV4_9ACTN|nr:maleylpyruvate isomerase family mycothiol-dependent enzyme [Nocardioides yefusunii]